MGDKNGRCMNFGNCDTADRGVKVLVTDGEDRLLQVLP